MTSSQPSSTPQGDNVASAQRLAELRRQRPKSHFLRWSMMALLLLSIYSWFSGQIQIAELFTSRRASNLKRFLTEDALPKPLRNLAADESGFAAFMNWSSELWNEFGMMALTATFWISILAMVLAGSYAMLTSPLGARTLMHEDPFVGTQRSLPWRIVSASVRGMAIFLRAIPEYIWAFLLISMMGPSAWPAVLALAIHNAGIMSRLGADTIENLPSQSLRALRLLGGTRKQVVIGSVFSMVLPRFLLFFFYRFETCVREATILGMLGVFSLGYWVDDSRSRGRYDEMLYLIALGALLVLIADLVSWIARGLVRDAGTSTHTKFKDPAESNLGD
jgi:phosphonate transport system permease protein